MSRSPTEGYTLAQVEAALTAAVNLILGDPDLYPRLIAGAGKHITPQEYASLQDEAAKRDRAFANMVTSVARSLLRNPGMDLDNILRENWPQYTATTVRGWVK